MHVMVVGGAGYIGSHTVRQLLAAGHQVTALDNLSSGHRQSLPDTVPLIVADLLDKPALEAALRQSQPDAVIHFAALIEVGESMRDPGRYYLNNVAGSVNLLQAIADTRVVPLVFSSTAAVYGDAGEYPIPEDAPKRPSSTYGHSKWMVEQILSDFGRAYGLPYTVLRYFNVCGAHPDHSIGEDHPNKTHLIELALLTALGQREKMFVNGSDYPTPDGTCVRDYVHVLDLAQAHVLALEALQGGGPSGQAYNVGLGHGFSVRQVLDAADSVVGFAIPREEGPRRAGDPASLVADPQRICSALGFAPQYTQLTDIVQTAWDWHRFHPHGFDN